MAPLHRQGATRIATPEATYRRQPSRTKTPVSPPNTGRPELGTIPRNPRGPTRRLPHPLVHLTGPRAIVDEYRREGDAAAERLDSITQESAVRREAGNTAVITFTDRVRHAGRELVHTCEQVIEVDGEGLVTRIEHRDLPGEPEALRAFYRAVRLAGGNG